MYKKSDITVIFSTNLTMILHTMTKRNCNEVYIYVKGTFNKY